MFKYFIIEKFGRMSQCLNPSLGEKIVYEVKILTACPDIARYTDTSTACALVQNRNPILWKFDMHIHVFMVKFLIDHIPTQIFQW